MKQLNLLYLSLIITAQATAQQPLPLPIKARIDNGICSKELNALVARNQQAHMALQSLLNIKFARNQMPLIGAACSGGGYRAAIATLGFLRGLGKLGLLNTLSYLATLSGSTWTTSALLVNNMTLDGLTVYLKKQLSFPLKDQPIDKEALIRTMLAKIKDSRPVSFNDIWGTLIGTAFFTPPATGHYLSRLEAATAQGRFPIPIFASVVGPPSPTYQWAEFTPFEVGSTYLNTWIPTAAFGKKFSAGLSTDQSPEEHYSYLLGLFGSAYAASAGDVIADLLGGLESSGNASTCNSIISCIGNTSNNASLRLSPPRINNFSHNVSMSPLRHHAQITMLDAGLAINIPIPPLMRRKIGLYIICDASDDCTKLQTNEMRRVEKYARDNNIPFPTIDYDVLIKHPMSLWYDPVNPRVPVVVYLPNFNTFSTAKFSYTATEFDKLMLDMEAAVVKNVPILQKALEVAINNTIPR